MVTQFESHHECRNGYDGRRATDATLIDKQQKSMHRLPNTPFKNQRSISVDKLMQQLVTVQQDPPDNQDGGHGGAVSAEAMRR